MTQKMSRRDWKFFHLWSSGGEILLWRAVENAENKPSWKVLRTLQWVPDCLSALPVLSRGTIRCTVILLPELVESWEEEILQRGHGVSLFLCLQVTSEGCLGFGLVTRQHVLDVRLCRQPVHDMGCFHRYSPCVSHFRVDYLNALRLLKSHQGTTSSLFAAGDSYLEGFPGRLA